MGDEQTHTLYYQTDNYTVGIVRKKHINGYHYIWDGEEDHLPLEHPIVKEYGTLTIKPSTSILPTVAYRCTIEQKKGVQTGSRRLDRGILILDLAQTDKPLVQALYYLNARIRMIEHRVTGRDEWDPHEIKTTVALGDAYPGEVQWVYSTHAEEWTPEEMLPLEDMLHKHVTSHTNNYWELERKADADDFFPFKYYASKHRWHTGWHGGKTPQALAQVMYEKEFKSWEERKKGLTSSTTETEEEEGT